jgi:hypothetical protein
MGGIADRWGVSESFFMLGSLMLPLCVPLALIIRRFGRLRIGHWHNPMIWTRSWRGGRSGR